MNLSFNKEIDLSRNEINLLNLLVIFSAVLFFINVSFFKINLGQLYLFFLVALFTSILFLDNHIKINIFFHSFCFISFLSIFFNHVPSFFRPYERLFIFAVLGNFLGPGISGEILIKFRSRLFSIINSIILVFVVASFFGIVLGLSSMVGRGGYSGFFSHSMLLGPFSGIAVLFSLKKSNNNGSLKKIWYLFMGLISMITCIASGSRAAVISVMVGGLFYFFILTEKSILAFLRSIFVTLLLVIFTFPLWQNYTERIVGKMEYSQEQGDLLVTRSALWNFRIQEFMESPLIGIGFASVDIKTSNNVDKETGIIEPGSSWLTVFSMTGLIGGFFLLSFFRRQWKSVLTIVDIQHRAFLIGLFSFFVVHLFIEGYLLSAGSGLFFYFWLLMGTVANVSNGFLNTGSNIKNY